MGPLTLQEQLTMALPGPIITPRAAADALELAHCICSDSCR